MSVPLSKAWTVLKESLAQPSPEAVQAATASGQQSILTPGFSPASTPTPPPKAWDKLLWGPEGKIKLDADVGEWNEQTQDWDRPWSEHLKDYWQGAKAAVSSKQAKDQAWTDLKGKMAADREKRRQIVEEYRARPDYKPPLGDA
tara:strand:- start:2639 stop:3070 length:432 start_codon:yes stop_codon:yes gene_type:complete